MSSDHLAPPGSAAEAYAGRRSAAEEGRAVVAAATVGTLATLTGDGEPWASVVTFAALGDGAPVLCVSTYARHGRNLAADARASLAVAEPFGPGEDLSDCARVTLAGVAEAPVGGELDAARDAYHAAIPRSEGYSGWDDFAFWVLRPAEVRWVGGFGRMDSATAADYAAAEVDPVLPHVAGAIEHLNADHADALLAMARGLAGLPHASAARCRRADRYGLDLSIDTPEGEKWERVAFAERVDEPDGLRAATVELTRRARLSR
jgi:putative heme iron utilization protein